MNNSSTVDIFINSSLIFQTNLDIPMNVRPLSLNIQKFRMAVIVFGTLINFLVIVVICNSRQLFYPRHMFWVAISLINQKCIIQAIMEILAIVGNDKVACQIFVLNAGVNYTIVLVFLALAALDRYLAIARYEWYKKKVTNKGTICLLTIAFAVTYLAATSPFWTGYKNIKNCTINMTHMHVIFIHDLMLGIICITLHVMIFIRLRAAIRKQSLHFRPTSMTLQFRQNPSNAAVNIHGKSIFLPSRSPLKINAFPQFSDNVRKTQSWIIIISCRDRCREWGTTSRGQCNRKRHCKSTRLRIE